jgi:predicted RecB family nuclease
MHLSKSHFTAGVQCHKLLWWKVHEPLAPELQPDKVLLDRFDQGRQVGELARAEFPGGVLIAGFGAADARVSATQEAIAGGAHTIYEGAFVAGDVRVAVDVLTKLSALGSRHEGEGSGFESREPKAESWRLVEAKMTSSQKEEHIPDAAIQLHVVEASGLDVKRVDIMHLNGEFRHPDQGKLLVATDVTVPTRAMLPTIQPQIDAQLKVLGGSLPDVAIGGHCFEPRDCPFMERCWPQNADHIRNLYSVGPKRAVAHMAAGIHSVWDLPKEKTKNATVKRQLTAMNENRMIVEPALGEALKAFDGRLGFLDFETIMRAVPVWDGMKPHEAAPAQFSYHQSRGDGTYSHDAYLAEGPKDCRAELVGRMLDATKNADRVVMYSSYEKTQIRMLQQTVPMRKDDLVALEAKLVDLLPIVRENVYHPGFQGSFSIKYVLSPLVPDLSYNDLIIVDGLTASVEIARLLFVSGKIAPAEHARVRQDLLNYCERDTLAMVRLLERLTELAR